MKKIVEGFKKQPLWVKISLFMAVFIIVHTIINWDEFSEEFMKGISKYTEENPKK